MKKKIEELRSELVKAKGALASVHIRHDHIVIMLNLKQQTEQLRKKLLKYIESKYHVYAINAHGDYIVIWHMPTPVTKTEQYGI